MSAQTIAGRRVTVIGAGSFIGRNLCAALLAGGAVVRGTSTMGQSVTGLEDMDWRQADLRDPISLGQAVNGAEIVFHLASTLLPIPSNREPLRDIQENLAGTIALMDCCVAAGVRRVVFASSGGTIYGKDVTAPTDETAPTNPQCSYGIVKLAIEKYAALYRQLHGLSFVSLRISNPYGPYQRRSGQGLVGTAIAKVLAGERIDIWGDGSVVRDFIHIDDVVAAILSAALAPGAGLPDTFNIGSGSGLSVRQVLGAIEAVHGAPLNVAFLSGRPADIPVSVLAIARAKQFLGWEPRIDWQDGIARTYRWMAASGS